MIVFGILIIVKGLGDLFNSRQIMNILMAILTIIVGALLIFSHWFIIDWFFTLLGVLFILDGALALLGKRLR